MQEWIVEHIQEVIDAVVATGTLLLAFVTWRLAVATRQMANDAKVSIDASTRTAENAARQADASLKQTEVSLVAMEASIQPLLVVPQSISQNYFDRAQEVDDAKAGASHAITLRDGADGLDFTLPIKNEGVGVARILRCYIAINRRSAPPEEFPSSYVSRSIVPPNNMTTIYFQVPRNSSALKILEPQMKLGIVNVELIYTNFLGTHPMISKVNVTALDAGGYTAETTEVSELPSTMRSS